jgi:hypothetical protein
MIKTFFRSSNSSSYHGRWGPKWFVFLAAGITRMGLVSIPKNQLFSAFLLFSSSSTWNLLVEAHSTSHPEDDATLFLHRELLQRPHDHSHGSRTHECDTITKEPTEADWAKDDLAEEILFGKRLRYVLCYGIF